MQIDLNGKTALITAAGSGIGQACAVAMARAGAEVWVTDISETSAKKVAEDIAATGGKAVGCGLDVSETDRAAQVLDEIRQRGGLDILHNHAGLQVAGRLDEIDADLLQSSFQINVQAIFSICKIAMPQLVEKGGNILNTASNAGVFVDRGMLAYNTTKAATIAMTKQMALDWGGSGIRINAICPGWVDTSFNLPYERQLGGRQQLERVVNDAVPLKRFGRVDEIAAVATFLVSPLASYITGQAIVVDGGEAIAAPSA